MPVEFLSDEQAAHYGRFAIDPTPEQLTCYFFLNEADLALIAERRRDYNKLGFAVQLCTLRYLGTFLPNPIQVPKVVVQHVAQQLEVSPEVFLRYALREETRYTHRRDIIAYLGYREFDDFQVFRLVRWIYAHLAVSAVRPSVLFDLATAHLISQKIVLPGDLSGVKVRPAQSTIGEMVKMFGGTNVQASAPESRDAIERGVADEITFPWGSIFLFGIGNVPAVFLVFITIFIVA